MCDCASCDTTDRYSGLPDLLGDIPWIVPAPSQANGRHVMGFQAWPRGDAKGAATSDKEYKAHAKHCGADGLPKPWRYVSRPPQFNTAGLVMPIPQAPRMVLDYIASGPKSTGPVLPGPDARPAKPAKVSRHLPELDRQREPAVIYAMPKSKPVKRGRGRPAIPGRFVVVKLEERLIAKAEKIGGKVTAGIREALERVKTG